MRRKRWIAHLVILLLLPMAMACSQPKETVYLTGVPVQVLDPDSGGLMLDEVEAQVHQLLPRAFYSGLVFEGECDSLSAGRGILVVQYNQIKLGFLRKRSKRVMMASAVIYTAEGYMDLDIVDFTGIGIALDGPEYPGSDAVFKVLSQAQERITEMGLCEGDITITQRSEPGRWTVRCGSRAGGSDCNFDINLGLVTPAAH